MSPTVKVRAQMFAREHFKDIGLTRRTMKGIEAALARAFENYREEIARKVESSLGTADWIAISKAVGQRIRPLM